jgi:hypothetical protein
MYICDIDFKSLLTLYVRYLTLLQPDEVNLALSGDFRWRSSAVECGAAQIALSIARAQCVCAWRVCITPTNDAFSLLLRRQNDQALAPLEQ